MAKSTEPSETTPKLTLKRDPDYEVMFPDEAVFFTCHINVSSGWTYTWYREGKSIGHSLNNLTIDPIETAHQGLYKCQAKRGLNYVFSTDISKAVHLTVDGIYLIYLPTSFAFMNILF